MKKKKRNIAIGVGIAAGLGGLAYMSKRAGAWEPPPNGWDDGDNGNDGDNGVSPDGWTDGVKINDIVVMPNVSYLGETVQIGCKLWLDFLVPEPVIIHGIVRVNGEILTGEWMVDVRNPTVILNYTPSGTGVFTASAQDKSAMFEVSPSPVGVCYSPWGGIRIPNPVIWTATSSTGSFEYDYSDMSGIWGFIYKRSEMPAEDFMNGYATWHPVGLHVNRWTGHATWGYAFTRVLRVIPLEWTGCPEYWSSKDEMANALVKAAFAGTNPPWYTADGTHTTFPSRRVYDIAKNLAFQTVGFNWSHDKSGNQFSQTLGCPYCSYRAHGPMQVHSHNPLPVIRAVIEHVEQNHPQFPLTQRRY